MIFLTVKRYGGKKQKECVSSVEVDCCLTRIPTTLTPELLGRLQDHPKGNGFEKRTITTYD